MASNIARTYQWKAELVQAGAPGVPLRSGKAAQSSSTYTMYFENLLLNHIKYLQYNKYLRSCPATFSNSFFRQQSS